MNEILGTLNKLTKTVTQTSGTVLKSTKLSMSLANEEDSLKSVYIDIGKKVHEIYLYGGNLGKFFDEKYAEITQIEKKITEIKEQLDSVKGTKSCAKCGKRLEKTAEFCQKCGFRMGSVEIPSESEIPPEPPLKDTPSINAPVQEVTPVVEQVSVVKCRVCGAENSCGSRFCLSCGRIV